MSYYDNAQEYHDKGIDYGLHACLKFNPQEGFEVEDIKRVLAVWEGENDVEDWRWILELNDGRFIFLQGGCDYTGWDCQSWATHIVAISPEDAVKGALGDLPLRGSSPMTAGMGHIVGMMMGEMYTEARFNEIYNSLLSQVQTGKNKTWSEGKDEEFGLVTPKLKIAVVGSREYKNIQAVKDYVASLPEGTTIISGGARGVDTEAEVAAITRGLPTLIFKADWDTHGKSAGMVRNQTIIDNADEVVAFWDGQSKGTQNTIERALAASNIKKVTVYKE